MGFARVAKTPSIGDKVIVRNHKCESWFPGTVTKVSAAVCHVECERINLAGDTESWTEKAHVVNIYVQSNGMVQ